MSDTQILGIEVSRGKVLPEWIDVNDHMKFADQQGILDWPAEAGRQMKVRQPINSAMVSG